jgi:hypothetical protein
MTKTDVVLAAIRKGCEDRKLWCLTTSEIAEATGMPASSVATSLANLRRTGRVKVMTYDNNGATPDSIGKGWTLQEFWR